MASMSSRREGSEMNQRQRPRKPRLPLKFFELVHGITAVLFAAAALVLVAAAAHGFWLAVRDGFGPETPLGMIEAIGIAAVAVVALQIAQTIAEEEVIREAHVSGPTRVRRFLSRFMVVIVVALTVEALIGTFKALHEDVTQLGYVAALIASVGMLLLSWGAFVRLNSAAEELEPEAMEEAKREDAKLS